MGDEIQKELSGLSTDVRLLEQRINSLEQSRDDTRKDRDRVFWGILGLIGLQVWEIIKGNWNG